MANFRSAAALFAAFSMFAGSSAYAAGQSNADVASESVDIAFDYQRGGIASSQYAIWVEDAAGKPVRTLFVTRFTATRGFSERPDAVPTWVARANPAQMTPDQVDAVSGATPSNGSVKSLNVRQTSIWDGKDDQGKTVSAGTYTVFLEGTLYWNTRVLYSAQVQWGGPSSASLPVKVRKNGTSDRNKDMLDNVKITHTMAEQP